MSNVSETKVESPSHKVNSALLNSNTEQSNEIKSNVKKSAMDFYFCKLIGEGSFSMVYVAEDIQTQKEYAIKVCEKKLIRKEKKQTAIMREKQIMNHLNIHPSPFFTKLFCAFQDDNCLYFVMNYARNGELLPYINKMGSFDEKYTLFYGSEILLGIEHLHKLGIIHRDLKPENILLNEDMHINITDFGSAFFVKNDSTDTLSPVNSESDNLVKRKNSFVGTAQYVSPEMLSNKKSTYGSDIWAFGCILYQMIAGFPPFRAPNQYLIFQKIMKLDYEFDDKFDAKTRDLIESILKVEPLSRIGSEDIVNDILETSGYESIKNHPFFETMKLRLPNIHNEIPPSFADRIQDSSNTDLETNHHKPEILEVGLGEKQMRRLLNLDLYDNIKKKPNEKSLLDINPDEFDSRMSIQKKENPWHRFVENNLILKQGYLDKKKGLFARRRMFLLTTGPHLYYVDPVNKVLKGQIPWSSELSPVPKNFKIFFVHTPNRIYYLEDPEGNAHEWCKIIDEVKVAAYNKY